MFLTLPENLLTYQCWPVLLEAQRVITIATRFTADLKHTLEQRGDMRLIYEQMKMLDAWISSVSVQAKSSAGLATPGAYLDDLEGEAAAVGRQIAMIKLCRYVVSPPFFFWIGLLKGLTNDITVRA